MLADLHKPDGRMDDKSGLRDGLTIPVQGRPAGITLSLPGRHSLQSEDEDVGWWGLVA